jgi:hypothetical protein
MSPFAALPLLLLFCCFAARASWDSSVLEVHCGGAFSKPPSQSWSNCCNASRPGCPKRNPRPPRNPNQAARSMPTQSRNHPSPRPTPSHHTAPKYAFNSATGVRLGGIPTPLIRQKLRSEFGPAHLRYPLFPSIAQECVLKTQCKIRATLKSL